MALTVRFPKIDYSAVQAHWARSHAFSQHRNATSFIPTPIEPWLIKVLQNARPLIPATETRLLEDIDGFIAQESQHFRQHRMFNRRLVEQGYPEMAVMEKELEDDLDEFLKNRSLKFQLAYADGFESLGALSGWVWFEKSDEWLAGADPELTAMWKWHMAEEFEHRHVCFDLYHTIYGKGFWNAILNGYFYRIYGLLFAIRHLTTGYMNRMYEYLMTIDRAKMSPEELEESKADEKRFKKFLMSTAWPLLANLLPWYNPSRKRTPRGLMEYLKRFETGGDYSRTSTRAEAATA
ncbi:metal-dependent hydrolase [Novosphingobium cyanobacteriorum]|uniref:Metal-dependent hydrolase n=1 Tax=Novosphingobium cyanobacteriorum TaxID=3024215 RepID=A0ABT6CLZ5_9SPHN|nr:metal-dependent hydrolase [Novosphingobium cyanobacteriorum]MDF8334942.1 metal-dependent hydrolase [Novosphingobium cyanobacteriorum]